MSPFTFTMPKLSPTMESGTITRWHKKEGDFVKSGDVVLEVATDKATVEHAALDEGFLRQILVKEGQEAVVNQAIAIFTTKASDSIEGYKPEGAVVTKKVEPLQESEKKEAVGREPAKKSTTSFQEPAFTPAPPLKNYQFEMPMETIDKKLPASPLAKKLAKEKGIDLTTVRGSGPHGRITSHDLALGQQTGVAVFGSQERPHLPPGSYEEESLSPMRKIIAKRLQESKSFIPHFYVTQQVNAEAMTAVREQLKASGIKISINDLIVRATALALRDHPEVNSGFNSATSQLIRFKTIDIAIAVSLPSGLITPIVRHADYKNVGQLSVEIRNLADKARAGKLTQEEYVGGSFTISNLGMFGVTNFVAIINPPQAAILAVSGIEDVPVVKGGLVVPGKVMGLTLSADHRVIDGADAAKFLNRIKTLLENPALLLVS